MTEAGRHHSSKGSNTLGANTGKKCHFLPSESAPGSSQAGSRPLPAPEGGSPGPGLGGASRTGAGLPQAAHGAGACPASFREHLLRLDQV